MSQATLVAAYKGTVITRIVNKFGNGTISKADEQGCFDDLADLTIPDGIVSGLTLSTLGGNVITAIGSWKLDGVIYNIVAPVAIPYDAQDATLSRYDVIYADNASTIHLLSGVLSPTPFEPDLPDGTIRVGSLLITPTSVTIINPPPSGFILANGPPQSVSTELAFTGRLSSTYAPNAPTDFVRVQDLDYVDSVLSGLGLSTASGNVTIQPGRWRLSNIVYSTIAPTILAIDAQDATLSRYDTLYADNTNTIHIISGSLSSTPVESAIPNGTIHIGSVLITPTTVTTIPTPPITDYVNTTSNQSAIAGNKSWTGNQTFGANVLMPGLVSGDVFANSGSVDVVLGGGAALSLTQPYRHDMSIVLGGELNDFRTFATITPFDGLGPCNVVLQIFSQYGGGSNFTQIKYDFLIDRGINGTDWYKISPLNAVLGIGTHDYALEIKQSSGVFLFRIRRTAFNNVAHDPEGYGIWIQSTPTYTLSTTNVTGNDAVASLPYAAAEVTVIGKNIFDSDGNAFLKQGGGGNVTSISGVAANGFSWSIANPTTTPAITLTLQDANTSQSGQLTGADWNTFNNKLGTISGISAGGELSGTYPNPTLSTTAVTGKLLTGLSVTGGAVVAGDSIIQGFGKLQNQINSIVAGGLTFKGVWNATTNSPTITSGVGTLGWLYIVGVGGPTTIDGQTPWVPGDALLGDGTVYHKIGSFASFISFNGRTTGTVVLTSGDVTGALTYTPANINAPNFTGIPTAATAADGTSTTQIATTAFVQNQFTFYTKYFDGAVFDGDGSSGNKYTIKTGGITSAMLAGTITNGKLQNSTISGVALGSALNALSQGFGITAFSYTGASGATVAVDQTAAFTWSNTHIFNANSLGAASSNQVTIGTSTNAALGAQQNSGGLTLQGNGWGTLAGTSQPTRFRFYVAPVQGTVPTAGLNLDFAVAAGGPVQRFIFGSTGNLTLLFGGLAATSADAIYIRNATISNATVGQQVQNSGRINFGGHVWNQSGTPADNFFNWKEEVRAASVASPGVPTTALFWASSLTPTSTQAYTDKMSLDHVGNLKLYAGGLTFNAAGSRFVITEGGNSILGQTTLVAGVKVITINGLTTLSRAFPGYVNIGGSVTNTWRYKMVCTANTLTITAVTTAGATNAADLSILNYIVFN